jgi:molecular chaperone GrpE
MYRDGFSQTLGQSRAENYERPVVGCAGNGSQNKNKLTGHLTKKINFLDFITIFSQSMRDPESARQEVESTVASHKKHGMKEHKDDEQQSAAEAQCSADAEAPETSLAPAPDEQQQKVEKAEQERQDIQDRYLRTLAEFENYKKRVAREKAGLIAYGTEKLALELLPVIDNFERAFEQAKKAEHIQPVVDGVAMILKQLEEMLKKFNITPFNTVGERFDPEKHEAMAQQEKPDTEDNTVVQEFQRGYLINEKLLRPARVIVSKKPSQETPPSTDHEPKTWTA